MGERGGGVPLYCVLKGTASRGKHGASTGQASGKQGASKGQARGKQTSRFEQQ